MHYDYIFAGGGAAGLSLAYRMATHKDFQDKKILIIDKARKNSNDRTWCFWTTQPSIFEEIVCKTWDRCWFYSPIFTQCLELAPYQYKMIRGKDFYEFVLKALSHSPSVTQMQGEISEICEGENGAHVVVEGNIFTAKYIFNSIPDERLFQKKGYHYLKQHFKGWFVRTEQPIFDPQVATFMDFRIEQKGEARFFYLLPTSSHESLVEFTIFGKDLLTEEEYTTEIQNYFKNYLPPTDFEIVEEEFGVIPMGDAPLKTAEKKFIIYIGTRGGQTKASSGYTFYNIQRQSDALIAALLNQEALHKVQIHSSRFREYDAMLLNVMEYNRLETRTIFGMLFQKHPIERVFRFLNNESHFGEELKIMASMPSLPFLQALVHKTIFK